MIEAIIKFGTGKGMYLGIKRILRCHPFGGSFYDPVPLQFSFFRKKNRK